MDKKIEKHLLQKEIKVAFRDKSIIGTMIGCNIIMFLWIVYNFTIIFDTNLSSYATEYKSVVGMYNILLMMGYVIFLMSVPFTTAVVLAKEYEEKTLDILLLTELNTSQIVNAKVKKIILIALIMVVSILPMLSVVFSVGAVSLIDLSLFVLIMLSSIICFSSVGLYLSVKTKKVFITSIVVCLVELIFTVGTYLMCGFIYRLVDGVNVVRDNVYIPTQMKGMGNLLIINPAMSILKLQSYAQGSTSTYRVLMQNYGVLKILDIMWIPCSIVLQLVVAFLFVRLAKKEMRQRHLK